MNTAQLRAAGLDKHAVGNRVEIDRLHPVYDGVFSLGGPPQDDRELWMAAVLRYGKGTALSDTAAAELYGLLRYPLGEIHVTTTAPRKSRQGIRAHYRGDVVICRFVDHIPVTTPEQTIRATTVGNDKAYRRIVRQAQVDGLVSHARLVAFSAIKRGRPGVARMKRELATGPSPTRSVNEDEVLEIFRTGGDPLINHVIGGDEVDLYFPKLGIAVEVDGPPHDNPTAQADDAAKGQRLQARGIRLLRVRWRVTFSRPGPFQWCIAPPPDAGAPAGGGPSPSPAAAGVAAPAADEFWSPWRSNRHEKVSGVSHSTAIALRGVVKRYGEITAVAGLDLDVPEGTCVGLLGPNGAGKSTTMRMLTAQTVADEGEIEVLGFRLPKDSKQARAVMGVVPQLDNLDITLTVEQNLQVFARLYRVPAGERQAAVERALTIANLAERRDTKVDKLSGGMRRRLLVGRALVHRPRLLLLDEPTVGLDPQIRQELWALIDLLRAEGTSILMSTHYIEEAARLCDSVTIMSHGTAVAFGPPAQLVAERVGREVTEVYGAPARLKEVEAAAQAAGLNTRRTGTSVAILGTESANGDVPEGERRPANLEDLFVLLTGEEIE